MAVVGLSRLVFSGSFGLDIGRFRAKEVGACLSFCLSPARV